MNFNDFIDLNQQLHRAGRHEDNTGRKRLDEDRQIGLKLGVSAVDEDDALLVAWKNNVAPAAHLSLGAILGAAIRWTALLLIAFGLATGSGAAVALLRYDGTEPINILLYLGVIVGIQVLLLPILVVTLLFRNRIRSGFRVARAIVSGLVGKVFILLARLLLSPEGAAKLRSDMGDLHAENSLYARVRPFFALLLIQVFGVAFWCTCSITSSAEIRGRLRRR